MKTIIIVTSGILMTEVIWRLYKAYRHSSKKAVKVFNGCVKQYKNTKDKAEIFEVMFFSKDSTLCRSHLTCQEICEKTDCAVGYFRKLIDYLDSATDTLDICMYFFTSLYLTTAIINAHKRGVIVRMVLDESTLPHNSGKPIMLLHKTGIIPKYKQLNVLMHHKFIIVDNNILITGSVNWTMAAFFGNFENLMVTNETRLVKPFINEFEKIWTMFSTKEDDSEK
ncbi:mitochondrial cardiolipin hydrolase [Nylanderia fulva]|uniref:mitochondrial cardiolipin hydrolase n=1 Tax=Nylanderia fulva TaxID=613905 RepID=UPI0010FBB54B|nr:mitochondrial cardiolipin hydrolase [Nylanderia fulva]